MAKRNLVDSASKIGVGTSPYLSLLAPTKYSHIFHISYLLFSKIIILFAVSYTMPKLTISHLSNSYHL